MIPVQRSVGEVYVPSIQTKALMVPPISGNNFGIIQPDRMVGFVACLHYIFVFVVFPRDGINRTGPLLPRYTILRFRENVLQCLKTFLGNFNVVAS